jgi:elongator complex protein 1
MRNLRNIRYDGWSLPSHFRERSITAATWDLASDSVLCTLGPSEDDALIELVRIDLKSGSL